MATEPTFGDTVVAMAQPPALEPQPVPQEPSFGTTLENYANSDPGYDYNSLTGAYGQSIGIVAPDPEGVIKDTTDAIMRGYRRAQTGFASTLEALGSEGAGDWKSSIDAMTRVNQERYNRSGANWWEQGIEDITYMAPTLAASALILGAAAADPVPGDEVAVAAAMTRAAQTARLARAMTLSKAATAGILGMQTYGDSLDEVRELSGGKLTEDQMKMMAFIKGPLIQGGLEVATFPGEQVMGAGLANVSKRITGAVLGKRGAMVGAEELGKALSGPYMLGGLMRAGGVLKTFGGQTLEEGVQGAADKILNAYITGDRTSIMDVATRAYGDMLEAVPSIGMMSLLAGGVGHARAEVSRRETMNNVGTPENSPHWQDVKTVLYGDDAAARSRDDSMVQALTEMFGANDPVAGKAAAEHITQISRNLAMKERRSSGTNTQMPWDYVTGLSVGYMDLTPSQKTDLHALFKSGADSQAIFRFISQATPTFANAIGEVLDRIDTVEARKTRDSLLNTWNNLTGLGSSQIDTTIKNLGQTRLSEKVEAEAKADGIDITDTTADHFLSKTAVKRILGNLNIAQAVQAKQVDVEIGGKPFRLYVNGDFSGVLSPAKPTMTTAKGMKSIPAIKPEAVQQAKSAIAIAAEMTDAQKAIADQMNAKLGLSQPVGQKNAGELVAKSEAVKAEVEATRPEAIQKPADDRLQLTAESLMLQRAIRDREAGAGKWDAIPAERPAKEVIGEPGDQTQINDLLQEVDAEQAAAEAQLADLRAQREAGAAADIEARIEEAVAQMERIQAKAAEARAKAQPEVEAQAKEIVRQMEVSGVTDPKDQLTALKNQAKKLKLKIDKNANAQAIIAAIAQAQAGKSVAIESQRGDITDTISKGPPLASEGANTLKGLYLPDKLLMLYFQEADAGTFLHEWMHHLTINRLLPTNIELALVEAFGNEDEKKHGYLSEVASHEDAGNAILQFIKTDNIPSDAPASLLEAFNYIKGVLKESGQSFRAYTRGGEKGGPLAQEKVAPKIQTEADWRGGMPDSVLEAEKYAANLKPLKLTKVRDDWMEGDPTAIQGTHIFKTPDGDVIVASKEDGQWDISSIYNDGVATFDEDSINNPDALQRLAEELTAKRDQMKSDAIDKLIDLENSGETLWKMSEASDIMGVYRFIDAVDALPKPKPLAQTEQSEGPELSLTSPIKDLFQSLLSDKVEVTPSQEAAARATVESMRSNPPVTPETENAVIDDINRMASGDVLAQVGKTPEEKKAKKAWGGIHSDLNEAALREASRRYGFDVKKSQDLGNDTNGKWNENLYYRRLNELRGDLAAQRRTKKAFKVRRQKTADTAKRGMEWAGKVKPEWERLDDSAEAQAYKSDGGPKPAQWLKMAVKRMMNFDLRWLGDWRTLGLTFSNNNPNHPFYTAFEHIQDDFNHVKEISLAMADKMSGLMGKFNPVEKIKLAGREWTVQDALYFYTSANGDRVTASKESLEQKLKEGTLTDTEEQVLALLLSNNKPLPGNRGVVEMATINNAVDYVKSRPELVQFVNLTQELGAMIKQEVDASLVQVGSKPAGWVKGLHAPRIRTAEGYEGNWIEKFIENVKANGGQFEGVQTPSFIKTRSETGGSPINTQYVDIMLNYLETMTNFAVRLPTTHSLLTMLKELGPLAEQKFGYWLKSGSEQASWNPTWDRMRDVVLQSMTLSGRLNKMGPGERHFAEIAANTSMATLGFKPWISVVSQMFSMLTGFSDVGVLKGAATYARLAKDTFAIMGKDIMDGKISEFPLVNHPDFVEMREKSPSIIGSMAGEWEVFESMLRKPDFIDNFVRKIGMGRSKAQAYFYVMQVMDSITKVSIFKTAYTSHKMELMEKGKVTEAQAEDRAIKEAERAVLNHVPIIAAQQKVLFQISSPFLRASFPFISQIITYHNTMLRKFVLPAIGAYRETQGGEGAKIGAALKTLATKQQAKNAVFLWLLPALFWNMLMRKRPPEDEKELLMDLATYPLSIIPGLGDIVQGLTGSGVVRAPGPVIFTDVARGINAMNDLYQYAFNDEEIDLSKTYRNLVAAPADYLALPKYFLEAPSRIVDIREKVPEDERGWAAFSQFVLGGLPKERKE